MSTEPLPRSIGIAGQPLAGRVVSIDIFRGLTMAVMIFVNDLSSVHGLSKWTYHMPAQVNAMTYVDMVFPAFLFIVGMALPIAVRQRLKRHPSQASLWVHIVLRAVALLILGLILANAESGDSARMGLNTDAWALLALLGGVLLWNVYSGVKRWLVITLRSLGAVLIAAMYAIYRSAPRPAHGHHPAMPGGWIDFSYPEILGLIGLTYFAVCLLYVPTRRWLWAPVVWLVVLVAFNAVCCAHWIPIDHVSMYLWPFGNGAMPSITMAGVVVSSIFLGEHRWRSHGQKLALAVGLGLVCFAAGYLLRPLGISKIRATPTWCLWSIASSCVIFAALYWICDIHKRTGWAWLVRTAGSNTLLTYLLPDAYFFLAAWLGFDSLLGHWNAGWPGITRALGFTVAMLLLSHLLTRLRLRMQL
jgi:heparan-alpha-glucosaminide N-acetyltransferase